VAELEVASSEVTPEVGSTSCRAPSARTGDDVINSGPGFVAIFTIFIQNCKFWSSLMSSELEIHCYLGFNG
jgi:hypothetical protein